MTGISVKHEGLVWTGVRFERSTAKCWEALKTFETIAAIERIKMTAVAESTADIDGRVVLAVTLSGASAAVERLSKIIEQSSDR